MADDALTRKEAEMGRMTREDIIRSRDSLKALIAMQKADPKTYEIAWNGVDQLCDLALRALSLESVREEALKEAAKICNECRVLILSGDSLLTTTATAIARETGADLARQILRLQHAPARAAEGGLEEATRIAKLRVPDGPFGPWDDEPPYSGGPAPESPAKERPMDQENEDREAMRRDFECSVYEREAKEQPGEQNAAPNNVLAPGERKPGEIAGPTNDTRESARVKSTAIGQVDCASKEQVLNPVEDTIPPHPATAASDVAAMVKELNAMAYGRENATYPNYSDVGAANIIRQAATLIEKLGQGWIAVSERLPEPDKIVWVAGLHTLQTSACFREGVKFLAYDDEYEDWRYDLTPMVTHWMPLPPPPERP